MEESKLMIPLWKSSEVCSRTLSKELGRPRVMYADDPDGALYVLLETTWNFYWVYMRKIVLTSIFRSLSVWLTMMYSASILHRPSKNFN